MFWINLKCLRWVMWKLIWKLITWLKILILNDYFVTVIGTGTENDWLLRAVTQLACCFRGFRVTDERSMRKILGNSCPSPSPYLWMSPTTTILPKTVTCYLQSATRKYKMIWTDIFMWIYEVHIIVCFILF